MTVRVSTSMKDDLTDILATKIEGGDLQIKTGAAPGADNSATGTVLVTFTSIAFNASSGGIAELTAEVSATAVADGTAGHGWWTDGTDVMEWTVGYALTINAEEIVSGADVDLLTLPVNVG